MKSRIIFAIKLWVLSSILGPVIFAIFFHLQHFKGGGIAKNAEEFAFYMVIGGGACAVSVIPVLIVLLTVMNNWNVSIEKKLMLFFACCWMITTLLLMVYSWMDQQDAKFIFTHNKGIAGLISYLSAVTISIVVFWKSYFLRKQEDIEDHSKILDATLRQTID